MCLQPPWADAPCAGAAATGALPPRDLAPWACTETPSRRPAECAAGPDRLMPSHQDCILQEPRSRDQEHYDAQEPAEGMLSHLLLCSQLAWKPYPHVESIARKAGLTIRSRSRCITEKLQAAMENAELSHIAADPDFASCSLLRAILNLAIEHPRSKQTACTPRSWCHGADAAP